MTDLAPSAVPDTAEITVVVADDQPLLRQGMRAALESEADITVVGEAGNGIEAVRIVGQQRPSVVMLDINMPYLDGLEAARRIREADPGRHTAIVMLTVYQDDRYVFDALRAGAGGYLLKDSPATELIDGVRTAARGDSALATTVANRLVAEIARRPVMRSDRPFPMQELTGRETDVFQLLVRGNRLADIAVALNVGLSTVKSHTQHLYQKLGISHRAELVSYAYEQGLIRPGEATAPTDN
jgi:DNA-binding NarL/FixJ family response regulator